nr:unnamed protein product [Digitaria exilis]
MSATQHRWGPGLPASVAAAATARAAACRSSARASRSARWQRP